MRERQIKEAMPGERRFTKVQVPYLAFIAGQSNHLRGRAQPAPARSGSAAVPSARTVELVQGRRPLRGE
jgi:hypothetical protein